MAEAEMEPQEAATEGDEEASLGKRLLAEFVGTALFVAVGTGTVTALLLGPIRELGLIAEAAQTPDLGPQEQFISSLLAFQLGDVLAVGFAFATILAVLVYALGGISGAHFNPAVTFSLAVTRRFRWSELPGYWVFQVAGGILGAFIVAGIYSNAEPGGAEVLFGATTVAPGFSEWQALLAEAFITFILVTAIMAVAVDPRAPKGWSGLIIGLALAGGLIATAAATGGSANFARTLGPLVASLPFDAHPKIPWEDLWIYAVGPLIGGATAALVYEGVTGLEQVAPPPQPGAATPPDEMDGDDDEPTTVTIEGEEPPPGS